MTILVPLQTTEPTANPFQKNTHFSRYIKWNISRTACENFRSKPILKSSHKTTSNESQIKPNKETLNFGVDKVWNCAVSDGSFILKEFNNDISKYRTHQLWNGT